MCSFSNEPDASPISTATTFHFSFGGPVVVDVASSGAAVLSTLDIMARRTLSRAALRHFAIIPLAREYSAVQL